MLTNVFLGSFKVPISIYNKNLFCACPDQMVNIFQHLKVKLSSSGKVYVHHLRVNFKMQPQDCNCLKLTSYIPAILQMEKNYSFPRISLWFVQFVVIYVQTLPNSTRFGQSTQMHSSLFTISVSLPIGVEKWAWSAWPGLCHALEQKVCHKIGRVSAILDCWVVCNVDLLYCQGWVFLEFFLKLTCADAVDDSPLGCSLEGWQRQSHFHSTKSFTCWSVSAMVDCWIFSAMPIWRKEDPGRAREQLSRGGIWSRLLKSA